MTRKLFAFSFLLLFSLCAFAQRFNFSEKITPPNVDSARVAGDQFGASVSISGNYAIVGAVGQDYDSVGGNFKSGAGAAYIFEYQNGGWGLIKKITPPDTDSARVANDQFGYSVAIDGNYAVIGATAQDWDSAGGNYKVNAGAAYIFERQNGVWGFVKKITPPNTDSARVASDQFGYSVGISGNYIIVGARSNDYDSAGANSVPDAGAAYIFERRNGVWGYAEKLSAGFNGARFNSDNFGSSVSISGNYAIAGASQHDLDSAGLNNISNAGAAYVFERNSSGAWNVVNKLSSNSGRVGSDFFGCAVAIDSSGYAVAGAYQNRWDSSGTVYKTAPGGAYVYERRNGNWLLSKKITPPSTDSGWVAFDHFGFSVAINGKNAVIASNQQGYDSAGGNLKSNAGAAYIFTRNNNNVWNYNRKITAPNADRFNTDGFGRAVAISDTTVIVGSNAQDWDSAGGNYKNGAGAAYFFGAPFANNLIYNNGWVNGLSPTAGTGSYTCTVQAGTATIAAGASVSTLTVDSGATASLSGAFNISGNYTNNGTVSGAGKIVLNGASAQNIYGTGTTGNLELNNSTGATIQDSLGINGVLTLTSGTLTTNNKLKLEATGATTYGQIAGTGAGTITGSLTAEMMVAGGGSGWRPVSSPLAGATLADVEDDVTVNYGTPDATYATVYYFNEETDPYWTIPADNTAAFGDSAYSLYMGTTWSGTLPLTLDIPGTYRGTTDYTYNNLTRTGTAADTLGWHYLANPWPSGFLWDDANITINSGGVQGNQVWMYNQSTGSYQVFDGTDNGVIPPFSPLLLEVTAGNTSITLKNSARTTDSLVNYFDKTGLENYIEINVTGQDNKTDKVKFYTDNAATNGYDILDGNKRINLEAPNMYFVLEGNKTNKEVWNTLPLTEKPQLTFTAKAAGNYTFTFITDNIEPNIQAELVDKLSGATHDITTGPYEFTHDLTNIAERFELRFTRKSGTGIAEAEKENTVYVGSTGNQITVAIKEEGAYTIEVMDMLGRTIQTPITFDNTGQPETITVNGVTAGYYLVKVQGDNVLKTVKVFLK